MSTPDSSLGACTALMFKLSSKLSQQEFLENLHVWCGYGRSHRPYNFVHLPWSKLAVVNFIDAETCAHCFSQTKKMVDSAAGCVMGVRAAEQHGLMNSLADFYARAQPGLKTSKRVPLVFDNGIQIDLMKACHWLLENPKVASGQPIQLDVERYQSSCQIHLDKIEGQTDAWAFRVKKGTKILFDL
ncbi:unnamed protein product [Effrenium voratum]|nr:unnamed protein product [Effrenium voratum]